jgi:hypothetical protein
MVEKIGKVFFFFNQKLCWGQGQDSSLFYTAEELFAVIMEGIVKATNRICRYMEVQFGLIHNFKTILL